MKKIMAFFVVLASAMYVSAQGELMVFPDWLSTDGSQNFFYKNVVKTDPSGNVYITGATMNGSNNYDILVAKYNSSGELAWLQQYNGPLNGDDIGVGLYIDDSYNVLRNWHCCRYHKLKCNYNKV